MQAKDKTDIIELFELYQYKLMTEKNDYLVFSAESSMYPIVEIVLLSSLSKDKTDSLQKEYQNIGYGVFFRNEKNIKELENYLFDRSFNIKESNWMSQNAYKRYTDEVMLPYRGEDNSIPYKYINIPYDVERNFAKQDTIEDDLLKSIMSDLNKQGAQLIILEAAAGYGKTSTAYEILNLCTKDNETKRPFLMELYQDRSQNKFHYILLSQIERTFKISQKPALVIHNIKKGRIPLIIDGFDELLSADIDNGQKDADINKVTGILVTIAELLQGDAKIILTSRKTAIFSGMAFYEWYCNNTSAEHQFSVSRYTLSTPSIDDWIGKERHKKLPSTIEYILNPVLLGYLKYLNDDRFKEIINKTSLAQIYFTDLLKREKKRQALPFNVKEQEDILGKLASYFAGWQVTALSRLDIKDAFMSLSADMLSQYATPEQDVTILANALTNHVFLDRKINQNIGFLNDFIYGNFLMIALENDKDSFTIECLKNSQFSAIEKLILSASVRDIEEKKIVWKILPEKCAMTPILSFWSDAFLWGKTMRNYCDLAVDGKTLSSVSLGSETSKIENCCFSNMIFIDCFFDFEKIQDYIFVNCHFERCTKKGEIDQNKFFACAGENSLIKGEPVEIQETTIQDDILVQILGKYYQVGGHTSRINLISRLSREFDSKEFRKAFNYLINKKYIYADGDKSFILHAGSEYYRDQINK